MKVYIKNRDLSIHKRRKRKHRRRQRVIEGSQGTIMTQMRNQKQEKMVLQMTWMLPNPKKLK